MWNFVKHSDVSDTDIEIKSLIFLNEFIMQGMEFNVDIIETDKPIVSK